MKKTIRYIFSFLLALTLCLTNLSSNNIYASNDEAVYYDETVITHLEERNGNTRITLNCSHDVYAQVSFLPNEMSKFTILNKCSLLSPCGTSISYVLTVTIRTPNDSIYNQVIREWYAWPSIPAYEEIKTYSGFKVTWSATVKLTGGSSGVLKGGTYIAP